MRWTALVALLWLASLRCMDPLSPLSACFAIHSCDWFTALYTFGLEFVPSFLRLVLIFVFQPSFLHLFINFIFPGSVTFPGRLLILKLVCLVFASALRILRCNLC
ncbi:hypothetical protein BKA70DRAFT_51035 [Coprinopsis sp. MPI-PUGE-AT-0042]|nr:hypothetical protein BKA70DRAFT_51035 [Coprinopsis sp. MPI-PUGE-AT-0042]